MIPLQVKNLVKNYGRHKAVDHITFSIEPGEIFGLLGPNGAGKTTTISIITTLTNADAGEIFVFGKNLQRKPIACKREMGIVPQELITHGFLNVEEILNFQAGLYGLRHNEEWREFLLNRLNLTPYRKKLATQLSGGLKRRLLIAKALIHKPNLLLLDEPTAGVDVELRTTLWNFIRELNASGMTVLLTTHYLEEAEQLCNRIGIIYLGKFLALEHTDALIEKYTTRKISLRLSSSASEITHKNLTERKGEWLSFEIPKSKDLQHFFLEASINPKEIIDISIKEGTLEDAFNQIIGSHQ